MYFLRVSFTLDIGFSVGVSTMWSGGSDHSLHRVSTLDSLTLLMLSVPKLMHSPSSPYMPTWWRLILYIGRTWRLCCILFLKNSSHISIRTGIIWYSILDPCGTILVLCSRFFKPIPCSIQSYWARQHVCGPSAVDLHSAMVSLQNVQFWFLQYFRFGSEKL